MDSAADRCDPASVRHFAAVIAETAQSSTATIRSLITGLRDADPAQSLPEALRGACSRALTGQAVSLDLRLDETVTIADAGRQEVLAVTGEALRNVVRHATASRATVSLARRAGRACLEIADDGRGFDTATAAACPREGHFGLAGMRERTALAGGEFEVTSRPGTGTRVRLTIPLRSVQDRAKEEKVNQDV
jgi:signal transduction histidine kinase